ncbi:MAG: GNAT family N-acetyltransferase [Dysgonomonas sp.]
MNLKRVRDTKNQDFGFIKQVYAESFPIEEQRPIERFINLIETEDNFYTFLLEENSVKIGFLTFWQFDDFIFAEHFAIDSGARNGGYGKKTIESFFGKTSLPIVLEVELPTTDIAKRRIQFYERQGFKGWHNMPYQQPPYTSQYKPIPMMLMTYRDIDLERNFKTIEKAIHETYKK